MILGIGTDIINVERIAATISRSGERLAARVLTEKEFTIYQQHPSQAHYLAKRFAAKEAAAKALGTGIGKVSWKDFTVENDEMGAPAFQVAGSAAQLMEQLGADKLHLSLSDEADFALAFVVLESCN